jgi:phosphopantetheine--protein transferase-like protein
MQYLIVPKSIFIDYAHPTEKISCICDAEFKLTKNFSLYRKQEFLKARGCARNALLKLGVEKKPILIGSNREPLWPTDITGSISHCDGFCVAIVAKKRHINSIGIDIETNSVLPKKLIPKLFTKKEIIDIKYINTNDKICFYKTLFSAKESFYKFIFPFLQKKIDFKDIEIKLDNENRSFTITSNNSIILKIVNSSPTFGKYIYDERYIHTLFYQTTS